MVGLPGQTAAHLARDVMWLHALGAEMIGVGPFIPHPNTPLGDAAGGTVEQTLRLVAVLRLAFPDAHLPRHHGHGQTCTRWAASAPCRPAPTW